MTKEKETNSQIEARLKKIITEQEKNAVIFDKTATFKYWDIDTKKGIAKLRLTEYSDYNEIASFLLTPYCTAFTYGICRKDLTNQFTEHIHFMLNQIEIVTLEGVELDDSHEAWTNFLLNYGPSKGKIYKRVFR